MKKTLLCSLPLVCLFAACSTPRVALEQNGTANLIGATGVAFVPQEEIYADINRSNLTGAMGGGLLFALADAMIDNASTNKAEQRVTEVRDALLGFNFLATLEETWKNETSLPDWFSVEGVEVQSQYDEAMIRDSLKAGKSVLVALYDYHVQPKFEGFVVEASVNLYKPGVSDQSKNRLKAAYYNSFSSVMGFGVPETFSDEAMKQQWVSDASAVLIRGQQEIVNLFAYDVTIFKGEKTRPKGRYIFPYGVEVKQKGGRVWYRDNLDQLHSVFYQMSGIDRAVLGENKA